MLRCLAPLRLAALDGFTRCHLVIVTTNDAAHDLGITLDLVLDFLAQAPALALASFSTLIILFASFCCRISVPSISTGAVVGSTALLVSIDVLRGAVDRLVVLWDLGWLTVY